MKSAMKKLFSLMLVVVLLVSAVPTAFADTTYQFYIELYVGTTPVGSKPFEATAGAEFTDTQLLEKAKELFSNDFPEYYTAEYSGSYVADAPNRGMRITLTAITACEALGHDWAIATCTTPKSCNVCGTTEGDALGHDWAAATCTTPKSCNVCEATEGDALGHDWDAATCTTPKSCNVCEATEGDALGHDWAAATHTAPKTCNVCGVTDGEPLVSTRSTVEIIINNVGTSKTFSIDAGKSVNEVYAAFLRSPHAAAYAGAEDPALTLADSNDRLEITEAGKTYWLWLTWNGNSEPTPDPEPTVETCDVCNGAVEKVENDYMCVGCKLDEFACQCNQTAKPENQKGKVKLILDYNYRGAEDSVKYVDRGDKLTSVIAGIPAPTRTGYLFSHWTLDAEGKRTIGRDDHVGKNGTTIYAQWDNDLAIGGDLTVRVNLNYDHKMGDSLKNIAKGTKMGDVLDYVNTPYRWGYKFVGWYWDAKGKNDVEWHDEVLKNCEIYAKWERVHNETMLKIYINGDTQNVAKIVDLHDYAKDGWITKDEVKAVVKQYYTAKDSDGLTYYGLFDAENWKSFVRNKNHDGSKHIEVNQGEDTTVYVMVHNAKTYASSSSTADSSNPKTGDTIGMAITMMAVSAAALAAVYVTSKKRAV